MIASRPGQDEVFIAIKEKGTTSERAAVEDRALRKDRRSRITTSRSWPPEAPGRQRDRSVDRGAATAQQEENPYAFGPMKIGLSPDGKFSKRRELNLVSGIDGAVPRRAGSRTCRSTTRSTRSWLKARRSFNRTQPQVLNAQSLPPEFDVAAGHQLPGTLTVPLASFPSGDYRLEIKVTDKTSGKSVVQNVSFTVLPT